MRPPLLLRKHVCLRCRMGEGVVKCQLVLAPSVQTEADQGRYERYLPDTLAALQAPLTSRMS